MRAGGGRLRIGFVGAGTIARERHVPGFRALPDVELTAVVNRTEASSRAAADEFGFERTARRWEDLVEDPGIDAIVVGTWPYLHADVTEAALDNGKHVLSQARMAMNAADARRMTAAADRNRELATLLVPASHTYWVDATLRRLLDDGAIGTLRTVDGAWNEPDVCDPGEWWRHQRRYSGNNVQGIGPLYEVLLRWIGRADAVTARTDLYQPEKPGPERPIIADLPDHVSILAEFDGGVSVNLEVSSHAAALGPSVVTFVGSDGALRLDLRGRTLERQDAAGTLEPRRDRPGRRRGVGCRGGVRRRGPGRARGAPEPVLGRRRVHDLQRRRRRVGGDRPAGGAPARGAGMTKTITFAGWGGHNQEAQARQWLEPFTRETGIEVRQETLDGYDELKDQVREGRTRWDVMVSGANFGLQRDAEWLERARRPRLAAARPPARPRDAAARARPRLFDRHPLASRPRSAPGDRLGRLLRPAPVPGQAVTYDFVQYGLFESALLADGVAARDLYPLDLDRAFRVIDRLRDDLIFTKDLEEADTLLASGEAAMALYSQNHAYLARHKSDRLAITWKQQILLSEFLVVPRGAPNRAEAMQLIDYILGPEPQSRLSRDLTYSPINVHATPDPTMAPHMTFTHRSPDDAVFDDEWWSVNQAEVERRFAEWKAARR